MLLEQIYGQLGAIAEMCCIAGAVCCFYLAQTILQERTPLVQVQRVALLLLSAALVANGSFYYPSWALVDGHRPTGALVDIALLANLLIMAVRGRAIHQTIVGADRRRQNGTPSRSR